MAKSVSTSLPSQERSCITYRLALGEKKPPCRPGSRGGALKRATTLPVLVSNKVSGWSPSLATQRVRSAETLCQSSNLFHRGSSDAGRGRHVTVSMDRTFL